MSSASKRVRSFLKDIEEFPDDYPVQLLHGDLREVYEERKYWKDRAERGEAKRTEPVPVNASTEEMLRKRLLQYGEFEKAVREALRLTPTYRNQNPEYNREQTERITAARLDNLSPSN